MGQFFSAQRLVKVTKTLALGRSQRSTVGARGEPQERVQVPRLAGNQLPPKLRRPFFNRLSQRLKRPGIAVLRCILPQLLKRIDERQRVLAHETQLRPKPVKALAPSIVEHQAHQGFILPVKEREGHRLVHRHDFLITKRGGKKLAERIEARLVTRPRAAVSLHDDRGRVSQFAIVGRPSPQVTLLHKGRRPSAV